MKKETDNGDQFDAVLSQVWKIYNITKRICNFLHFWDNTHKIFTLLMIQIQFHSNGIVRFVLQKKEKSFLLDGLHTENKICALRMWLPDGTVENNWHFI
jgi:hypothetical protein